MLASGLVQAQSYKQGQVDFNLGVGVGNTYVHARYYTGAGYSYSSIPTLNASGEYGVTDAIGIGGYIGYSSFKYSYSNTWFNNGGWHSYVDEYRYSFMILGVRGAYHLDELIQVDKLDAYGGLMLGYNLARYTYSSTDPGRNNLVYAGQNYGGLAYSLFVGARYRFTDNIGVFGELGYGISILNLGLNIKI